jgi:gas vesicle protein
MAEQNQKKQTKGKSGFNPVAVAVTGAVVGAGVVVAGAAALKDKKNREKVKEVLTNIKDQAIDYMEDMQKRTQDKNDKAEKKLDEGKGKVKKVAN